MKLPTKERKPEDFLVGALPNDVLKEFNVIDSKDEEMAEAELWTTESICFRYFNLLQEFKTTK